MLDQKILCKCGCGRELSKFDKRGRLRKFHPDCFSTGKPIPERVRKILSKQAKKPERIKVSKKNISKFHQDVREGKRKPSNWKDGYLRSRADGYLMVKKHGHPRAQKNGYVFEHIIIMEKALGRFLSKQETVHHINRIRDDNRIENLLLLPSRGAHMLLHASEDNRRDKKGQFCSFKKEALNVI